MGTLGGQNSLLVYLQTTDVPETGISDTLPIQFEFKTGRTETEKIGFEVLKAELEATVTEEVRVGPQSRGIDVELQNTGDLRADVEVLATAADERIDITPDLGRELLVGFLNVGVHDADTSCLEPREDLTESDRQLLRQSCETV